MTAIMIAFKCRPFGNQSLMIVDALHQYLPFFSDYQEKLKSADSLFYSWNGGLGYNFYSLWAYYLSSPLNLIIAVVPKLTMISVLNWIIAIKFSLCSLTGFLYFSYREGKQSFRDVAFGLCYAFSSYMTGYYWNVMWLEVMILLPIILIGMDRMMKQGKSKLYCLSLFAAMFCNYYMSFMICIFLVLWYFTYYFKEIKDFLKKGIQFVWNSVLAAAMAAVVLLPAYLGLMNTSSATLDFPEWKTYGQALDLFVTHMVGIEPYNMSVNDGLGNLYCGIFPVLLFVLYIIDRKLPWKEKLRKIIILVFMAVSFQVELLNYIWHGFHNQYGIPNRFAFLYIFLILIMAYDQIRLMDYYETKKWKTILSVIVLLAGIGYCYHKDILTTNIPYMISAALLIVYGILLCIHNKYIKQIICIFMIVEVFANAAYGFYCSGQVDSDYYFGDTADIKKITDKENPTIETRMELSEAKMLDESIWYAMPNLTMFGSTALGNTVEAMDQFGFYTGVNEYLYEGGTPVTDLLLGVKSILIRNGQRMDRTGYEYIYSKNQVSLYQNSLKTSIGYWMSENVKEWNYYSSNPFEVQNVLMNMAYNVENLYENIEVDMPSGDGCIVTDQGDGYYNVENQNSERSYVTFVFQAEKYMDFYLHFDTSIAEESELYVNGVSRQSGRLNSKILSVGKVEEGDTITLEIELKPGEEGSGTISIRSAYLNQQNYKQMTNIMKKNCFEMDSYNSTEIKGNILAKEKGVVFFSIPFDKGWTAVVDGEETQTIAMEDGFLSVPVDEGKHEIQLQYSPQGFALGWKVSMAGWILFLLPVFFGYCKKRFRKNSVL
jgi:uncharacterized membrane protein YfhO